MYVEGKRRKGKPKKRWYERVIWSDSVEDVRDRVKWKLRIRADDSKYLGDKAKERRKKRISILMLIYYYFCDAFITIK